MDTILIRGFDPLADAIQYGRELLPLVHEKVARLDTAAGIGAATTEPIPVAAG